MILGQGRTIVSRGILHTAGLLLSHRKVGPTRFSGGGNLLPKYVSRFSMEDTYCAAAFIACIRKTPNGTVDNYRLLTVSMTRTTISEE